MQRWEIEQIIPIKTVIYKNFIEESIIDLIFVIALLLENFIFCNIVEEFDYNFDHQPILL